MTTFLVEAPDAIGRIAAVGLTIALGAALGVGVAALSRRLAEGPIAVGGRAIVILQMALVLWVAASREPPWTAAASILLSGALLTLAMVDVAVLRLPDVITLPLIALGLGLAALEGGELPPRLAGAAAGWTAVAALALGFRRLRGREGMGMGDAKLLAAAGAWCGWRALPWLVLVACALAFLWIGVRVARKGLADSRLPLPFGAPLALAFWLVWLYGAPA